MPSPAWENLDDFLDRDDFAVEALVEFQAGGTRTVWGIFDDPYMNAQLGEYEADTSKPRLLAKESDFAGVKRGDLVAIIQRDKAGNIVSREEYDIMTGAQSTGDGMALLALETP